MANVNFNELITFTRATGGGRFNASGQYEWLSAGQPRFDYDPVTLEPRGILIEEQRTNLLLRSAEFGNSSWIKIRSSVTANATVSPDGTLTAAKLIEDTTTSSTHYCIQTPGVSASTAYTLTVYLKAAERTRVNVLIDATSGNFSNAYVDLAAGTVISGGANGTFTGYSSSLVPAGNGWYRLALTSTVGAGVTSLQCQIRLHNGTSESYTGDGTSGLYIWGAQLEAGAFPTSYIPTTTAQVTRAADLCSVDNLSPWYRADEGTLMVEYISGPTAGSRTPLAAGKGSPFAAKILMQFTASGDARNRTILTPATGLERVFPVRASVANTLYKQGVAWGGTSAANTLNGASPSVLTGQIIPDMPERVTIGSSGNSVNPLNGHIRRVRYIPRRISDTELQALTAL